MAVATTALRWLRCHAWLLAGALAGAGMGAAAGFALLVTAWAPGGIGLLMGATAGSLADRVLRMVDRGPSPCRCH
jgi:hypothetical protein